jgi:hypothetical protein
MDRAAARAEPRKPRPEPNNLRTQTAVIHTSAQRPESAFRTRRRWSPADPPSRFVDGQSANLHANGCMIMRLPTRAIMQSRMSATRRARPSTSEGWRRTVIPPGRRARLPVRDHVRPRRQPRRLRPQRRGPHPRREGRPGSLDPARRPPAARPRQICAFAERSRAHTYPKLRNRRRRDLREQQKTWAALAEPPLGRSELQPLRAHLNGKPAPFQVDQS